MEIGECVSCIAAFNGFSSECSFGCPSGTYGVFNSETNKIVFSKKHEEPILGITMDNSSNLMYFADKTCMYRYDTRTNEKPQFVLQLISEIISIAASGSVVAASTLNHGIILGDCRKLEKSKDAEKQVPATSISFIPSTCSLLTGYNDSDVGDWETLSETWTKYELPDLLKTHGLEVIKCFICDDIKCACYSSGVSIYKENRHVSHETLNRTCLLNTAASAPCFGKTCAIISFNDGSLVPFDAKDLHELGSVSVSSELVKSLTANSLMVAALFDNEYGDISIFTPEDFTNHEEDYNI